MIFINLQILLQLLLLLGSYVNSEQQHITIEQKEAVVFNKLPWKQVLDSALKYKKSILVDCMADYCLPCKQMEKFTYTDLALAGYLNEQFICVRWNGTVFDDMELLENYKVQKYPTLLFMNAKGIEKYRSVGFQSAKGLLIIAKNYKQGKLTKPTK
jgi:thiol:disulfide interchange protein